MWSGQSEIFVTMLQLMLLPVSFGDLNPFTLQRFNCPKSYTFPNARLQGGLQAGHFKRLGPPDDTELCVQRCCDQRSCDLVAWIGEHCYSVSCFSRDLCKPVRLPSNHKGMRLLYIASRDDAEDEVEPNRREVNDILHSSQHDPRFFNISKISSLSSDRDPVKKPSIQIRRIIRSLEEIEDEDHSGSINSNSSTESADNNPKTLFFSGNYYERSSESMNFKMEEPSDGEDWEGGFIGESGAEQDDDVTDDVFQTQTHGVSEVKRTEMASVVNPSDIEEFESDSQSGSAENSLYDKIDKELRQEGGEDTSADFSSSGSGMNSVLLSHDVDDQNSDGSGKINKTIMREVQRNLRKVWRYASSSKNLDMISKGPKGKGQERKLQEIYNLVIKHESEPIYNSRPKESLRGESSGLSSDESEDGSSEIHEAGSGALRDSEEEALVESVEDDISGESSGLADFLELSGESVSGSGVPVNRKLLKEVEHNLHKVWRYAAPKKDLDMVARGPKGKEEEQKVKKIYNIISKHESGSAFIDYDRRKKEKSPSDGDQTTNNHRRHKSRKSRVKLTKTGYNATEANLFSHQRATTNDSQGNLVHYN